MRKPNFDSYYDPPEPDMTCARCGYHCESEQCKCKECTVCGQFGCIEHMDLLVLREAYERFSFLSVSYMLELKRRYNLNPTKCFVCKQPMTYEELQQEENNCHAACRAKQEDEMEMERRGL